jgi:hypothetical protein
MPTIAPNDRFAATRLTGRGTPLCLQNVPPPDKCNIRVKLITTLEVLGDTLDRFSDAPAVV